MNPYRTLRSVIRFKAVETDLVERRLARAASVADLRRIAKRRLPGGVFDCIDGAAEDERTLAASEAAFAAVTYRPRVLRGVEEIDIGKRHPEGRRRRGERRDGRPCGPLRARCRRRTRRRSCVLGWFAGDLRRTMSLVGVDTIEQLDRSLVALPSAP